MHVITIVANSVSQAMAKGLGMIHDGHGVIREESRNGAVLVKDGPVVTHSLYPLRRVLLSKHRDANPFFHLFESLWMLAGRNDLPWVAQFNRRMADYSDDGGKTQPAAYGHRWRGYFGYDQLALIISELKANPGTRRAVLAMWDAGEWVDGRMHRGDLPAAMAGSKDVPCNTECYFTIRDGKLYMSVQCRSNDLLWGAHGANAVHFSILLEYVAAMVGVGIGEMVQYSWNYHLYDGILKKKLPKVIDSLLETCPYTAQPKLQPTPLFNMDESLDDWNTDLHLFMAMADPGSLFKEDLRPFKTAFFKDTAAPMFQAWCAHKMRDHRLALDYCSEIDGADWQLACTEWIERRAKMAAKKEK